MVPKDDAPDNVVGEIKFLFDQLDTEGKEEFLEKMNLIEESEKAKIAKVLKDLTEDPETEDMIRELIEKYSDDKPGLLKRVHDAMEVPTWVASLVVLAVTGTWIG